MITQRKDGSMYLNMKGMVFFNWWAPKQHGVYSLTATICGESAGSYHAPPDEFNFFTMNGIFWP